MAEQTPWTGGVEGPADEVALLDLIHQMKAAHTPGQIVLDFNGTEIRNMEPKFKYMRDGRVMCRLVGLTSPCV